MLAWPFVFRVVVRVGCWSAAAKLRQEEWSSGWGNPTYRTRLTDQLTFFYTSTYPKTGSHIFCRWLLSKNRYPHPLMLTLFGKPLHTFPKSAFGVDV